MHAGSCAAAAAPTTTAAQDLSLPPARTVQAWRAQRLLRWWLDVLYSKPRTVSPAPAQVAAADEAEPDTRLDADLLAAALPTDRQGEGSAALREGLAVGAGAWPLPRWEGCEDQEPISITGLDSRGASEASEGQPSTCRQHSDAIPKTMAPTGPPVELLGAASVYKAACGGAC